MRRLASYLVAVFAVLALAACSPELPTDRFECTCQATNVSVDNSRFYTLCESPGLPVTDDAKDQCATDLGADAECECTCVHNGDC